jgi:hypothetical protein
MFPARDLPASEPVLDNAQGFSMNIRNVSLALILAAVCVPSQATDTEEQQEFDSPLILKASEVLSAETRNGEHHEVREEIVNDGFMNTYVIDSPFGTFEAYGSSMLRTRINEIGALAELDGLSKTKVFMEAAAQSAVRAVTAPVSAAATIVTNPIGTVTGLPGGLARMFNRQKRKVEGAVATTASAAKSATGADDSGEEASIAEQAGEGAVDLGKSLMGTTRAERRWAKKLGTDPYTSNETLRKGIADVAVVDSSGYFLAELAVPIGGIVDLVVDVNEAIWERDAYELRQMNLVKLQDMGVAEEEATAFLDNVAISPTIQTLIINGLGLLETTAGRDAFLRQATLAEDEAESRFYLQSLAMIAWLNQEGENVAAITVHGPVSIAVDTGGNRVAMLPVDPLTWNPTTVEAVGLWPAQDPDVPSDGRVYISGDISALARSHLEQAGWSARSKIARDFFTYLSSQESDEP